MRGDVSACEAGTGGRWNFVNGLIALGIAAICVLAAPGSAHAQYVFGPGSPPPGPQILVFQNASGGAFSGSNWGGTAYLSATGPLPPMPPDYQVGEYTGASYGGFMFQAPPGPADTAILSTLSTGSNNPSANVLPTFPGGIIFCCSVPTAIGYVYPQLPAGTTNYSVSLGGETVTELDAVSLGNVSVGAAPSLALGGAFTATNLATFQTTDGSTPITVTGSGSLSSNALQFAGSVNVTSGTLKGSTTTIDAKSSATQSSSQTALPAGSITSSKLTLTGANSILMAPVSLYIGQTDNAPATLDLEGGAQATTGNAYVALGSAKTNGKIIIAGGSSMTTAAGFGAVGYNGTGEVDIASGGKWTLTTGTGTVYISGVAGSTGNVQVSGSGSALKAGGYIYVGQQGQGTLDVDGGATVTGSQGVYVSNENGSKGELDISSGGQVQAARDGGATAFASILGGDTGTNGTATIDGSGSLWQVAQSMVIGSEGTGSVTVQNGGKLEVDGAMLKIGSQNGSNGTLTLNGSGATLALPNGDLLVGAAGTGTVMLQNGALLDQSTKTLALGSQATGNGTIQVLSGSTFNVANLTLGDAGTGELDLGSTDMSGAVTTGTAKITGTTIMIGSQSGSNGTLEINGKSTLNFSGTFQDGVSGTGNINLQSGASLSTSTLTLGAASGGNGTLKLDSASKFTSSGAVTLGGTGQGKLTILSGSQATIGGDLILGQNVGSTGSSVSVQSGSGGTSKLTVTGNMVIGQVDQTGDTDNVTIQTGSQASVGKDLTVGGAYTAGTLTVAGDGTGSTVSSMQYSGVLNVDTAGSVDINNAGVLTHMAGGGTDTVGGKVIVEGAASDWKASSTVALTGKGTLDIKNGAHAEFGTLNIDTTEPGASTVTVDGSGNNTASQFTLTNALNIDNGGAFTMSGGATANVSGLQQITVGQTAGNSTLSFTGADTIFDTKAITTLGGGTGSGRLSVENGAYASLGDVYLNSGGSILASGLGSTLTINDLSFGSTGASYPTINLDSRATLNLNGTGTLLNGSNVHVPCNIIVDDSYLTSSSSGLRFYGNFEATDDSTVHLAGDFNSYALQGKTTISDSTLIANDLTLYGTGNVTNSTLTLNGDLNIGNPTLGNGSSGNGSLSIDSVSAVTGVKTIVDAGMLTLDNHMSVGKVVLANGTINLGSAGSLIIGGGSGQVYAPSGASQLFSAGGLYGIGYIYAKTLNGGVLKVGDDPGTITIVGNYTQLPTGTLEIEVGPASVSQLDVTGTATIAGTLALDPVDGATIRLGQTYNVLDATGGITGAFTTFDSGSPFITLVPELSNGVLDFTTAHAPNSFAGAAQTANQTAVANVLDTAANTASGDFGNGIDALSNASVASARSGFDSLSGEAYGDLATVALQQSRGFANAMLDRLDAVAHGAGDSVGITLAGDSSNLALLPGAPRPPSGATGAANRLYSVWAEGTGDFANNSGGAYGSHGFNTTTAGMAAGVDASLAPNWVAGAAFGYGHSNFAAKTLHSTASLDDYDFALYSAASFGRIYVRGAAGYVSGNASLTRGLNTAGVASEATGNPDSRQMFGALETGEDFSLAPSLNAIPFARLDAARYWQNRVAESNAGAFGLLVAGQTVNSVQTTLGSAFTKNFLATSATPLAMTVSVGWAHEFADTRRPITAGFADAPNLNFTVEGAPVNRNSAVVSTGVSMSAGRANIFLRYDGQYGSLDESSAVTGGVVFMW